MFTHECIDNVIEKYSDMVYKLAYSQTKNKENADDILQEVLLSYLRKGIYFDSEEHRKAWFIRVTINISKNIFRSAWYRHTLPFNNELQYEDKENEVYFSVLELPTKYRIIIHLFYYEDMSIIQICKILNLKESAVKARLTRARLKLKEKLKGDYSYV